MAEYRSSIMALPSLHVQLTLLGDLTNSNADDTYEYAVSKQWIHIWETATDEDGKSLPSVYMDMNDWGSDENLLGNVYIPAAKFMTLISWYGLDSDHQLRRRLIPSYYVTRESDSSERSVSIDTDYDFLPISVYMSDDLENEELRKQLEFFAWDSIEHLERQVRRILNVPRNVTSRLWLLVEKGIEEIESFPIKAASEYANVPFIWFLSGLFPEIKTLLSSRKCIIPFGSDSGSGHVEQQKNPLFDPCNQSYAFEPVPRPISPMLYKEIDSMMTLYIFVEKASIVQLDQQSVYQNVGADTDLDNMLQRLDSLTLIRSDWQDTLHNTLEDCSGRAEVHLEQAAYSIMDPKIKELERIKSQYEEKLARIREREERVAHDKAAVAEKQACLDKRTEIFTTDLESYTCQRQELAQQIESMDQQNRIRENTICLNVGGHRFMTSTLTLAKYPDSMLGVMFSGRHPIIRENDGSVFIDREGSHFGHILNFLRDGDKMALRLPTDQQSLYSIKHESEFYQVTELVNICEKKLRELGCH